MPQLIEDWTSEATRLWSMRLVAFWSLFNGALLGLAAFVGHMNPWFYLILNLVGYLTIGLARLFKQPGA